MMLALATARDVAQSPLELVVLIVCLGVYSLRAASEIFEWELSRSLIRRVNVTAVVLTVVLFALVILRFRALT